MNRIIILWYIVANLFLNHFRMPRSINVQSSTVKHIYKEIFIKTYLVLQTQIFDVGFNVITIKMITMQQTLIVNIW